MTTQIHAFDTSSEDSTEYVGSGEVPGYLLNRWAMSSYEGVLRVATTRPPERAPVFVTPTGDATPAALGNGIDGIDGIAHVVDGRARGSDGTAIGAGDARGADLRGRCGGEHVGGALLGCALGLWLARLLAGLYAQSYRIPNAPFQPSWSVMLAAVTISVVAALVGALAASV